MLNGLYRMAKGLGARFALVAFVILVTSGLALAWSWPADSDWNHFFMSDGTTPLWDVEGDSAGSRDIVGGDDGTSTDLPAAYTFNDGEFLYYRIRLDADPSKSGYLEPFGWGFLIDTDGDFLDYEWMIMIDGISDEIYLAENTSKTGVGDPSDTAEVVVWSESLRNAGDGDENFRVVDTSTTSSSSNFEGNADYFLDFRIPLATFTSNTGISEDDPINVFAGSSNSAQTLATDLVAGSMTNKDVIIDDGISDDTTPSGTQPTDGTVGFVSDASGSGSDVSEAYPGDTIYVQVDDLDVNIASSETETISVTVTTGSGDSETVTLTETGTDTGVFTGSVATSYGAYTTENGTLELDPIETVTVTYIDAVDGSLNIDQTRTDSLTAKPSADVEVSKVVSNNTPNQDDVITYTITATNNGPGSVSGVEVTDNLPSLESSGKVEYVSDDSSGDPEQSYNSVTGIWSITSLAPGASETINIDAKVLTGTIGESVVNTATKTAPASTYDPDSSNDSASATITINGSDLVLTKSVDNDTASTGESITYTITVTNAGSNTASSVEVSDTLPAPALLSYDGDDGGASTTHDGVDTITWTIGTMADGDSATLEVYGTVLGGATLTNTATVTTSGADPDSSNDTDTALIYVDGADLSVAKSVDDATPNEGDTVTYTISVTNTGSNTASGVEVTDDIATLAGEIDYVPGSASPDQGSYDDATGVWSVGTIGVGVTLNMTLEGDVQAGTAASTLVNSASVTASDQSDPETSNDSDTASVTVKSADLSVEKSVDEPAPNEGDIITYTITVTNSGPDTATGVEVTDTLPSLAGEVNYVGASASPSQGTYDDATGIWSVGTISPSGTATLTLDGEVQSGTALTTITNSASVTASDVADPDSSDDSDTASIEVGGADLEVTKTVDDTAPNVGATIVYTITVVNNGPNDATDIEITDALPSGLTYVSDTPSQGTYQRAQDKWVLGDIAYTGDPAVDKATLTITLTVSGSSGQTVVNTARVGSLTEADYDDTNDVDSATLVIGSTDVTVDKSANDPTPTVGDTVTYTITVTNTGSNTASGVDVTEDLPTLSSKLAYVAASASASQGSYDDATGIWSVGTISPSGTATLTLDAEVQSGTCGETITNTATKTAMNEGDPDSGNDTATSSVTVRCADLMITKSCDNATPNEGETITYTLTVTNTGPDTASGVSVVDTLPDPTTEFVDYLANDGGATHDGDRTLTWSVGTLAKNASATLEVYVQPQPGSGGLTITNSATVSATDPYDDTPANDTATYDISPTVFPNLIVMKTAQTVWDPYNEDDADSTKPKAIPGAYVDYTIRVDNDGAGAVDDSTIVITDAIPANTELFVGDLGAGEPVLLIDNTPPSGLTIASIEYDDGSGYGYDPSADADADGFNPNVTDIRVTIGGIMDGSESFSIKFRVRVE